MRNLALLFLLAIAAGCISVYDSQGRRHIRPAIEIASAHVPGYDYCAGVGWRHVTPEGQSQCDCFDEDGNVLPACAACYDEHKRLKPGCLAGYYEARQSKK